jgi:acyl-CoA synthetase (NDP forming)
MATDALENNGLVLAELQEETSAFLAANLPPAAKLITPSTCWASAQRSLQDRPRYGPQDPGSTACW